MIEPDPIAEIRARLERCDAEDIRFLLSEILRIELQLKELRQLICGNG